LTKKPLKAKRSRLRCTSAKYLLEILQMTWQIWVELSADIKDYKPAPGFALPRVFVTSNPGIIFVLTQAQKCHVCYIYDELSAWHFKPWHLQQ